MKDELNKIRKQRKENAYTSSGNLRKREKELHQKGTEEYIKSMGGLDDSQEVKKKVQVSSEFKKQKMKEREEQERMLEETEDLEMRGEILDSDGKQTKLGREIEKNLQEMAEKEKKEEVFEVNKEAPRNALNDLWNISKENEEVIAHSYKAFGTEFGLYASIPMLCKGPECVYAELYPELHGELTQEGERCPVEVALIMSKYDQYKEDLQINPEDAVDMSILRDVIDYDVQIVRAENKIAVEGDFVKDVVVGVSQTGTEIMQEQITQASEYKERIQKSRNKALTLLNSTRKDKAGEKLTVQMDPSSYTKDLLARANQDVFDADFEEIDEPEDKFEDLDIIEDEPFMKKMKGKDKNG